jgi:hypothetical protein
MSALPIGTVTVQAAVTALRALAEPPWPKGTAVGVRMGLHTGEPATAGHAYAGLDVHRAARIAAAAWAEAGR